ncbi:MAG: hypothetical protein R3225_05830 [Halofilum sp. (in: g-proteobacteria)]|nr:hypothetical protein [Halofilum sp. (in: g-proteobacteria)]
MASNDREQALADRIRRRLVEELEQAYDDAALQGLCGEGALEYALGRVRDLDPSSLLADGGAPAAGNEDPTPGG